MKKAIGAVLLFLLGWCVVTLVVGALVGIPVNWGLVLTTGGAGVLVVSHEAERRARAEYQERVINELVVALNRLTAFCAHLEAERRQGRAQVLDISIQSPTEKPN